MASGFYPGGCLKIHVNNHLEGVMVVGTNNRFYYWYQRLSTPRWIDYGGWISHIAKDPKLRYVATIGGNYGLFTHDFTNGYREYSTAVQDIAYGPN